MSETLIISNGKPVECASLDLLKELVAEIIDGRTGADEVCLESPGAWRRVDGRWFRPAGTHHPWLSLMRFAPDGHAPAWVVRYCDPSRTMYFAVSKDSCAPLEGMLCGGPARIHARCLVPDATALMIAECFFKERRLPLEAAWVTPDMAWAT